MSDTDEAPSGGESVTPPKRDRIRTEREQRQRARSSEFRRKLIGLPLVVLGVAFIAAGAYVFVKGNPGSDAPATSVEGTSVQRTVTTTTTP